MTSLSTLLICSFFYFFMFWLIGIIGGGKWCGRWWVGELGIIDCNVWHLDFFGFFEVCVLKTVTCFWRILFEFCFYVCLNFIIFKSQSVKASSLFLWESSWYDHLHIINNINFTKASQKIIKISYFCIPIKALVYYCEWKNSEIVFDCSYLFILFQFAI